MPHSVFAVRKWFDKSLPTHVWEAFTVEMELTGGD